MPMVKEAHQAVVNVCYQCSLETVNTMLEEYFVGDV